jgi:hypothetical protein
MIAQVWLCQSQQSRGKEHSLIIGMSYEQTNPLVPQPGKLGFRYRRCVKP